MERIRVLHREFARPHDAEPRPDLVAELGLDLVEIDRQLAVALELAARDVGDHFLVGRAVAVHAVVAVLDAQQLGPVLFPAARFLPQLGWLHGRHQHLERARPVHFLAHDLLDLAQHPQADGQPREQAAGQAPDQAGAQHELVADHLGIGRNVAQGIDWIRRESHFASDRQKKRRHVTRAGRPTLSVARRCAQSLDATLRVPGPVPFPSACLPFQASGKAPDRVPARGAIAVCDPSRLPISWRPLTPARWRLHDD